MNDNIAPVVTSSILSTVYIIAIPGIRAHMHMRARARVVDLDPLPRGHVHTRACTHSCVAQFAWEYIVVAYIIMAYACSYGAVCLGVYSYGIHSYGPHSYGPTAAAYTVTVKIVMVYMAPST